MPGERLILVKSCVDCPLKEVDHITNNYICGKTKKSLGVFLLDFHKFKTKPIPDWCPLMPADHRNVRRG